MLNKMFLTCYSLMYASLPMVIGALSRGSRPVSLLSDNGISTFGSRVSSVDTFSSIVNPLLVPRVVGTENHRQVRERIVKAMQLLNWNVELDSFTDKTPVGNKEFSNIIATLDPRSPRRLVLACHYDSKISTDGKFIGATDSAVPCAMLMQLALDLRTELAASLTQGNDVTLQFIFFDGEEAFRQWSAKDSIYGARHLAQKWGSTPYPPGNKDGTSELDRIDLLVLLDLLGAKNPNFFSYMPSSDNHYQRLATIEEKLRSLKAIPQGVSRRKFFDRSILQAAIEDDHIPFMKRGVKILHMIPSPFPSVWHTNEDNGSVIHWQTVEALGRIFRVFVAEYLNLQPLDRSP